MNSCCNNPNIKSSTYCDWCTNYGWISVGERLPESAGCYLVSKPFSRYLPYAVSYFDGKEFDCPTRYIGEWMPLPQPPKENPNG